MPRRGRQRQQQHCFHSASVRCCRGPARRTGAEASLVAAVDVRVAAKRLRGPELPTAERAGVEARRAHTAAEVPSRCVPGERQVLP
jgi:hypothetical protein